MDPMARDPSLADRVTDMLTARRAAFDTKALNPPESVFPAV